jgi:hypothetical protein
MRLLDKHIPGFGRLFLVLFLLLANSGFTVILYRCTMSQCAMKDEMSGMPCCAGMACCTAASCEDMCGPHTPSANVVTVNRPCQTATVVGGYQIDPTVVEKQFNGRQIIKIDLLPTSVFESAIVPPDDLPAFHFAFAASNVSSPPVETYLLNASFLI